MNIFPIMYGEITFLSILKTITAFSTHQIRISKIHVSIFSFVSHWSMNTEEIKSTLLVRISNWLWHLGHLKMLHLSGAKWKLLLIRQLEVLIFITSSTGLVGKITGKMCYRVLTMSVSCDIVHP